VDASEMRGVGRRRKRSLSVETVTTAVRVVRSEGGGGRLEASGGAGRCRRLALKPKSSCPTFASPPLEASGGGRSGPGGSGRLRALEPYNSCLTRALPTLETSGGGGGQ
jgi:hypothetical protein